jgi:hypothetical protein
VLRRDPADGAPELSQSELASTSGALPEDQTTLNKEAIIRIAGTAASAPILAAAVTRLAKVPLATMTSGAEAGHVNR